jgi:hypothetical protein
VNDYPRISHGKFCDEQNFEPVGQVTSWPKAILWSLVIASPLIVVLFVYFFQWSY